ncbi:MAG: thioredoxin [Oscillospiraceae bacterium]|nr:thioredoxin [Oscillospiraceae bacterium]MDD7294511.1 thioredoxin [Oscillospiraceae bacterium]MDY2509816.1 thioredoxin [Ruminococcus callidus]
MAVIKVTNDNFETAVLQTSKPVLIDFYATWCGPCRMVSPLVDEIAEENSDYQICKVDVDEAPELAQKFGVMSIPTLVVLKGGKVVAQNVGALPKSSILDMLKQA